ncbi:hypothetical protein [Nannocystis pusilla]|uniref:hypothetical protein n=1 Tax=Nannocystis pusilla TaxID=889268 RepID=UPI003B7E7B81
MQDNLSVVPPALASDFAALGLSETLLRALRQEGHTTPTPIQAAAIPCPPRPRPVRLRPDGHRQDGGVRAADRPPDAAAPGAA